MRKQTIEHANGLGTERSGRKDATS
jgi:hypothetical protein